LLIVCLAVGIAALAVHIIYNLGKKEGKKKQVRMKSGRLILHSLHRVSFLAEPFFSLEGRNNYEDQNSGAGLCQLSEA
jgi:hypothetical protein